MEQSYEITDDDMTSYVKRRKLRAGDKSTWSRTQEGLRKFQRYLDEFGFDSYRELDEEDMEMFLDFLLEDGGSDLTVKGLFSTARVFLQTQGIDAADDVDLTELGDQTLAQQNLKDGIHYVTKEEHLLMRDHYESLREELICELLWETGIRRSEAASIQLNHIDRDEESIWIDNAKNDDNRIVYYSSNFSRILRKWLDRGGRAQYDKAPDSNYLICTSYSTQVQDKYPNEVVKRVADRAGILGTYAEDAAGRPLHHPTAHSYRHSFAVYRVKGGMNLKFLSLLMGHQSVEVTADNYLHFKQEEIKKANEDHRPKF
jgi:integrase/recombinase XerD